MHVLVSLTGLLPPLKTFSSYHLTMKNISILQKPFTAGAA